MRRLLLEATRSVAAGGNPKGADSNSYRKARAVDLIVADATLVEQTFRQESIARF